MNNLILGLVGNNLRLCANRFSTQNASKCVYYQQKRFLDLHEYQSKQILHEHGVQVQRFKVITNPKQAKLALFPNRSNDEVKLPQSRWDGFEDDISNAEEFVIKAQVLAGGRGKGYFKESGLKGGVRLTQERGEALKLTQAMLDDHLVTKQTGDAGVRVEKVMIAEAVRLRKEFYLAILLDRSYDSGPILVASPAGGMDIEEVAERDEKAIRRFTIPLDIELDFDTSRRIAMAGFDLNMHELDIIDQCAREIMKLYALFLKLDATQIEINPLGVTTKREVISVDAKLKFDENARFRHRWLDELETMNTSEEDKSDAAARKHNLNFIALDGSIGCLVNGAGLAMATMDIIKLHGGQPANFLDVGGGATARQVTEAFRIILANPKVEAIFVNIFGGIMRCDVIAEGIIEAAKELRISVPIVCRLQGTRVDDAREMIEKSGLRIRTEDGLDAAAKLAVDLTRAGSASK